MAVTLANMLDDIRDLLDDVGDTKVSIPTKTRWINNGQAAMWPSVYTIIRDETIVLATNDFEYSIPSLVGAESILIGVEVEITASPSRWIKLDGRQYDVIPHLTQQLLVFQGTSLPAPVGNNVRVSAAIPLEPLAVISDVFSGPIVASELPVMYAMHKAMAMDIERRLQWNRFSTTQGLNQTSADDFVVTSEKWYNMFLSALERVKMPTPGM